MKWLLHAKSMDIALGKEGGFTEFVVEIRCWKDVIMKDRSPLQNMVGPLSVSLTASFYL